MAERATVLIVSGDPTYLDRLAAALAATEKAPRVLRARDEASALELVARSESDASVDIVLADLRIEGGSGIDLLRVCRERAPQAARVLFTAYEDLPEVVRTATRGLLTRVVPRTSLPERVATLVAELTGEAGTGSEALGVDLASLSELLRWTAASAIRGRDVVIRQIAPDAENLKLELVLPNGPACDALREELVKRWLWPVKPKDGTIARAAKNHPVTTMLGALALEHEVYARKLDDDDVYAYVALLPWRDGSKLTVALGVWREERRETLRRIVLDLHRYATDEVAEYPLPVLPSKSWSTKPGVTVDEYDWIATGAYVGRDRRAAETPFIGRHTLRGRRKWLPRRADAFVDGLAPFVPYFAAAYILLSLVDTALTWRFVGHGSVQELNPLLRPVLETHPWLFVVAKNVASLIAFFVVARFQLFRVGKMLLGLAVLLYFVVDVYWVFVLS